MVELVICRAVVTPGELREIVANVSVAVHRLRERLMRYGIKIENRYGIGYTMLPDSREIIKARVGQFAALNAA